MIYNNQRVCFLIKRKRCCAVSSKIIIFLGQKLLGIKPSFPIPVRFEPIQEIEVFIGPDESEQFHMDGESIQTQVIQTKQCKSPIIFSVSGLLESEESDELEDIEIKEEINDTIQHEKKINGPFFTTTGGRYDKIEDGAKKQENLIQSSVIPLDSSFYGIEQDLWEDSIHWDSDDSMDDILIINDQHKNSTDDNEPCIDLELLKQMNLWPPKQAALDITNELDIQLPKKRLFSEVISDDDFSSSDDEIEEFSSAGTVILPPSSSNLSQLQHIGATSLLNSAQTLSKKNTNKTNVFEEVTNYKIPYQNVLLQNGDWVQNIIWDENSNILKSYKNNNKRPPILFDLNDKNMLYEDDFEQKLALKDPASSDKILSDQQDDKDNKKEQNSSEDNSSTNEKDSNMNEELDPYNLSLDDLYITRKSSRRNNICKAKIYHSPVALQLSLVRTYLSKESLEYFHKPRTKTIPDLFPCNVELTSYIPTSTTTVTDSGIFKKKSDLSSCDGDLIMLEYIEKHPLILMNIGMASKFVNYTRKKDDDEDSDNEFEIGETVTLEKNEDSPFLGEISPGQTVHSFDNNLFRVPLAQHKSSSTDFLLIKSRDDKKLTIRPLPEIYCTGQIQPMVEVPAPNSRAANNFSKYRLQSFIYRFFKRKSKKYPYRLRIADVCAAFPWHSDANVRKYLKQIATFQRSGDDSGWWTLKKDLNLPTEEQLQSMTNPEHLCLFESMRVGLHHLQNLGKINNS